MKLTLNKYKKISNKILKDISIFEAVTNYGLYSGDHNLFKTLTIYELLKKTEFVKGDIIEFGVWKGNTSILIKKIIDIFKINKKMFLLDHFKGLQHYQEIDKNGIKFKNKYKHPKYKIEKIIKNFEFKNIEIIDKDATKIESNFFNKKQKFSLAILDVDLYQPTKKILISIDKHVSKNGLIVFDEGQKKLWPGENKALKEFLKKNKSKYKLFIIDKNRQPDCYLQKIKD